MYLPPPQLSQPADFYRPTPLRILAPPPKWQRPLKDICGVEATSSRIVVTFEDICEQTMSIDIVSLQELVSLAFSDVAYLK